MSARVAFGLFAKPAVAGQVKTRLCPPLTPSQAAELYRAFLIDTACALEATGFRWGVFSPDPGAQRAGWPEAAPAPGFWRKQNGNDLGERMLGAIRDLAVDGSEGSILVGSDHPSVPVEKLRRGAELVTGADLVLGPALDGGYYLIGMRAPRPRVFQEVPWSTPAVLPTTLDRIREERLSARFLDPWYDVDDAGDLRFLRNHLEALALERGEAAPCPHTRAVLAALSLEKIR